MHSTDNEVTPSDSQVSPLIYRKELLPDTGSSASMSWDLYQLSFPNLLTSCLDRSPHPPQCVIISNSLWYPRIVIADRRHTQDKPSPYQKRCAAWLQTSASLCGDEARTLALLFLTSRCSVPIQASRLALSGIQIAPTADSTYTNVTSLVDGVQVLKSPLWKDAFA